MQNPTLVYFLYLLWYKRSNDGTWKNMNYGWTTRCFIRIFGKIAFNSTFITSSTSFSNIIVRFSWWGIIQDPMTYWSRYIFLVGFRSRPNVMNILYLLHVKGRWRGAPSDFKLSFKLISNLVIIIRNVTQYKVRLCYVMHKSSRQCQYLLITILRELSDANNIILYPFLFLGKFQFSTNLVLGAHGPSMFPIFIYIHIYIL